MSSADITVEFEVPDIKELSRGYAALPKSLSARTMAAACKRALAPGVKVLKRRSPKGPTGNLQRAVAIKSVSYGKDGTGVAVVGYTKAGTGKSKASQGGKVRRGKDRAFHQFWIEFGTKERRIKKPAKSGRFIASSYKSLGPFRIFRKALVKGERAVVQSAPKYPKAFFRAAPAGEPLVLPPVMSQAPVAKTWDEVRPQASGQLEGELRQGLVNARKQLEIRAAKAAAKKAAAMQARG